MKCVIAFLSAMAMFCFPVYVQGQTVAVIPQVAAGSFDGGATTYSTSIQVINSESTAATLTIQFFNPDGSASGLSFLTNNSTAATFKGSLSSITIPSNDSIIIRSAPATQGGGQLGPGPDQWHGECGRHV